jgi:hypothetical protein
MERFSNKTWVRLTQVYLKMGSAHPKVKTVRSCLDELTPIMGCLSASRRRWTVGKYTGFGMCLN